MNKTVYQIMSVIILLALTLGSYSSADASSVSAPQMAGTTYYVSATGNDANAGTQDKPFLTYKKAISVAPENSLVYIRGGTYSGGGADFASSKVTVKNYPGEQVIIQLKEGSSQAFNCWTTASRGAKTDIHIIGSDVEPRTLSNGVISKKGIVITDSVGSQRTAFHPHGGCDRWEIAGIDFINVASAIFQLKETNGKQGNLSADNWYVHDNRVYGFYREVGMQFNGNDNVVENNEILKVSPILGSPYGCYLLNLLGHGNTVRGNTITGTGGTECSGLLFEWSQSDANLIEGNTISGVKNGIEIQGGDNNTIKDNVISASASGIAVVSYPGGTTDWPCSDYVGSWDIYPLVLIPPNDPTHVDYSYYYPYGECQSTGTTITGNTIKAGKDGILLSTAPSLGVTTISGNTINFSRSAICNISGSACVALPLNIVVNAQVSTNTPIPATATATSTIGVSQTPTINIPTSTVSVQISITPTASSVPASPAPTASSTPAAAATQTVSSVPASPIPATVSPILASSTPTASPVPASRTPTASPVPVLPTSTSIQPPATVQQPTQPATSETIYDDKHSSFVYSTDWRDVFIAAAYGGSFKKTNEDGSVVTFTFTGQSFSVLYTAGPKFGKVNVYVDGVLVKTIDENERKIVYQKRWNSGQLTLGKHTLKLVVETPNGSIDAVIVR